MRDSPAISSPPVTAQQMTECPACAEQIPAGSAICPLCRQSIAGELNAEQQRQLLEARVAEVQKYSANPEAVAADAELTGALLSTKTKVLMGLLGLSLMSIVSGIVLKGDNGAPFGVFGILGTLIFVIPVCVSWYNDSITHKIAGALTAHHAFKGFYTAVATNRAERAFACLAPSARNIGPVPSLTFNDPKIPSQAGQFHIKDVESFKAYWKSVFTGPSSHARSAELTSVKSISEHGGVAMVEANITFTSYPSWIVVFVISPLIFAIVYLVIRRTEKRAFRKILIRGEGRWYVAESELAGPIDAIKTL
ncbi:MAG TPA: RING finger protein [Planctomycetota bacterium]|nr:RING finger protein [Planctomycetota bacterium]